MALRLQIPRPFLHYSPNCLGLRPRDRLLLMMFMEFFFNDWLIPPWLIMIGTVHMDRHLVNPLELLNVSCYGPWEYTQKFGANVPNFPNKSADHRAPWDDPKTLLYRYWN